MTVKEMKEKLNQFDENAEIVTFNRTSRRWFKTGPIENYAFEKVADTREKVGEYAKKQMESFNDNDVTVMI